MHDDVTLANEEVKDANYKGTVSGIQSLVLDVWGFNPECGLYGRCDEPAVGVYIRLDDEMDTLFIACKEHGEDIAGWHNEVIGVAPVAGKEDEVDFTWDPEQMSDDLAVMAPERAAKE